MSIYDQINEQMKTAMRARDKERSVGAPADSRPAHYGSANPT